MGQILHKRARTTAEIRREIQHSQESIAALADCFGVNPKTISKWRGRKNTNDAPMGRKDRQSVLSAAQEEVICAFRRTTQLPLDDCYIDLKDQIPTLSRSNLHRCLVRNGLNNMPKPENTSEKGKKRFKNYDIGYIHVDITIVHVGKVKLYLFVAINRVCKYAYAEIHQRQTALIASRFLDNSVKACPFKIHTLLTDNGPQFTFTKEALRKKPKQYHQFDIACKNITSCIAKRGRIPRKPTVKLNALIKPSNRLQCIATLINRRSS